MHEWLPPDRIHRRLRDIMVVERDLVDYTDRRLSGGHSSPSASSSSAHGSGAGHGSNHGAHKHPACWSDHAAHTLSGTLAFTFFCLLVCSALDHCNYLVPFAWRFPITCVMYLAGMGIGSFFLYRSKDSWFPTDLSEFAGGMRDTSYFDPHALLYIVLPPLLYESAASMNWHTLRKILPSVLLLAIPGVMLNTLLTSFFVKAAFRVHGESPSWEASLLTGSILSATDPVAVVSALAALGAPAKLSSLIEGESLLNDGSAAVACYVFRDWVMGDETPDSERYCKTSPPAAGCVFVYFLHVAGGGFLVGLVAAGILQYWVKWARYRHCVELELCIVLTAVYGTFYVAEAMHCSGILATVTIGFLMTYSIRARLSHEASHSHHAVLSQIAYVCNQVVFFGAGIISARFMWGDTKCAHTGWKGQAWAELIGLYFMVHITRGATVLTFYPFLRNMGYGVSWKEATIMVFGGLRGAVGLIMGLIVEHNHYIDPSISQMVAFHTSGIVLLTLFFNGSTIDGLYKRLHMYPENPFRKEHLRKLLAKIEEECLKAGIKVLVEDWFFRDCSFKQMLNCVPRFTHITWNEASLPVPSGIESVAETLSRLGPDADDFRDKQVSIVNERNYTLEEAWAPFWEERFERTKETFDKLKVEAAAIGDKKDYVVNVAIDARELRFHAGKDGNPDLGGLYLSLFPLSYIKTKEDDDFGFEITLGDIVDMEVIVGLVAVFEDQEMPARLGLEGDYTLGFSENTVGFNLSLMSVTLSGIPSEGMDGMFQTDVDSESPKRGDKVKVLLKSSRTKVGSAYEIVFVISSEDKIEEVECPALGSFSSEELYPAVEFRPIASGASFARSMSQKSTRSKVFQGGNAVVGGVSAVANAAAGTAAAVGTGIGSGVVTIGSGVANVGKAAVTGMGAGAAKVINVVAGGSSKNDNKPVHTGNHLGDGTHIGDQVASGGVEAGPPPGTVSSPTSPDTRESYERSTGSLISGGISGMTGGSGTSGGGARRPSDAAAALCAKVKLSYEPHQATDEESVSELFHVLFNTVAQKYHHMHEHGILCEGALFLLTQALGDAMDNVNREKNAMNLTAHGYHTAGDPLTDAIYLSGGSGGSETPVAKTTTSDSRTSGTASRAATSGNLGSTPSKMTNAFKEGGSSAFKVGKMLAANMAHPIIGKTVGPQGLFDPILCEYVSLATKVRKQSFFDKLPATYQCLRAIGYGNTRCNVEALWAFATAHEEILEKSPAMERYPQLVHCVQKVIIEVHEDLATIMELQPRRFFYCKHTLALRVLMNKRHSKLQKFVEEGWISSKDADALNDALWERIAQVDCFAPGFGGFPSHSGTIDSTQKEAWQGVKIDTSKRKLGQQSLRDRDYFEKKKMMEAHKKGRHDGRHDGRTLTRTGSVFMRQVSASQSQSGSADHTRSGSGDERKSFGTADAIAKIRSEREARDGGAGDAALGIPTVLVVDSGPGDIRAAAAELSSVPPSSVADSPSTPKADAPSTPKADSADLPSSSSADMEAVPFKDAQG